MYKHYNTSDCSLVLNLDFDIAKNNKNRETSQFFEMFLGYF